MQLEALSFYGIPIKIGDGVWGVVIIDSRDSEINGPSKPFERLFVAALGKMISLGAL